MPDYYIFREQEYRTFHRTTTPQTYYLSYGYKYAQKFSNESHKFSEKGQQWVQEVMLNLQKAMEDRLDDLDGTDLEKEAENFQDFAFESHVNAYWNINGTVPFYELEVRDLILIFQIIDIQDLLSLRGLKQEFKLGEKYINHIIEEAQRTLADYTQLLQKIINSKIANEK